MALDDDEYDRLFRSACSVRRVVEDSPLMRLPEIADGIRAQLRARR